jgi:hypothetical protein
LFKSYLYAYSISYIMIESRAPPTLRWEEEYIYSIFNLRRGNELIDLTGDLAQMLEREVGDIYNRPASLQLCPFTDGAIGESYF